MLAFLGSIICMHPLDVGIMGENNRIYLVMMPFFSGVEHSIQKPWQLRLVYHLIWQGQLIWTNLNQAHFYFLILTLKFNWNNEVKSRSRDSPFDPGNRFY